MNLLRTGLMIAGSIVIGAGHAVAGCPAGTVSYRETTKGNATTVHCHCIQPGFVYYNNKCRDEREAEDLLMDKIRNAAEGANRTMQSWSCEQISALPSALGSMLESHVKSASAALFLMRVTKSSDWMLYEGVTVALDAIELDVKEYTCTINENSRVACQNLRVFMKTLKDARHELASIHKSPQASIGPAEPTPPRDASMWADPSDPNLDAYCHSVHRVRP